jgi:hypothetical protein
VRAGREAGMSDRDLQQLLRDELKRQPARDERAREVG